MNLSHILMLMLQTCSHGTACNFIHCFRNPGGDYEWADSDKPPPKYWVKKMAALFGHSDESVYDRQMSAAETYRYALLLAVVAACIVLYFWNLVYEKYMPQYEF